MAGRRVAGEPELQLPEIISALSFALDLTEGAIPGHAVRSTLLGMRMGMALGLPAHMLAPLYYALQLKDVGCSSNAARMAQLFGGDDRAAKAVTKLTDWTGLRHAVLGTAPLRTRITDLSAGLQAIPRDARRLWSVILPGANARDRLRRALELGKATQDNTRELLTLRCDRGASILRKLNMSDLACESVRHLDEHWDGSGYPDGLAGEAIPVLARVAAVAQNLDVFATAQGIGPSLRTLQRRSGTWFDPEIVRVAVALDRGGLLWDDCQPGCPAERTQQVAISLAPDYAQAPLPANQVDTICEAFAEVVDAKSPFTFRHSVGVTEATLALAEELQLPERQRKLLQRAALLHDLGKLGIPNSILDKPGRLTEDERQSVLAHPGMSRTILSRITGFEELARVAGEHHERLDGSGYPHGLKGSQLSMTSQLLALADCFAALIEDRPYRNALPLETALQILEEDVPHRLDPVLFEALQGVVQRWTHTLPAVFHRDSLGAAYSPPSPALSEIAAGVA